ncbi:Mycothiol acetyltransferase [Streptomyces sp. RB5]|uniref:Mycothiol acetyltransferase n=1 Tax=Streptomyces smaragdinus TaxID=2585196 RepID=A0A7K0CCD5_9ACTN|nr:N-acetyltransferase [Streptomyces smaragdinus]MQY11115.1 Mycothiol acetyltransferase [Streptomyces smaragdinus]
MDQITFTNRDSRTSLGVRLATEEDLLELDRIDRALFGPMHYPFFVLRQLFDVHGQNLLVLADKHSLYGYVLLGTNRASELGWILGLGVDEPSRRSGHGRRLMLASLRQAAAMGLREVRLTVEPENAAAIQLYRSLGFTAGEQRDECFGPGGDRLTMSATLPAATV